MNLIEEYNQKYEFFRDITGVAMKVYNKYRPGLLESAYEAAMKYLTSPPIMELYEPDAQAIWHAYQLRSRRVVL